MGMKDKEKNFNFGKTLRELTEEENIFVTKDCGDFILFGLKKKKV